ncbi:vWA domain-containing protein [Nocardia sp. NRRL S-836]|uniref:vWA domain-containing protein n=1 Tax=Nocardia sp. NRRL S-836 TaxID=1519492 RepID=UPI0006C49FF9|nr:vWA domain-containing protein [Nocardia sp. NRRL S-836]KOV90037.1 hypothetical protein ADL03_01325 [Nocardia sp. NRRL S-836]
MLIPQRGPLVLLLAVLATVMVPAHAAAQDVPNPPWPKACPLKLGLLVDRSDSMGARFDDVREATRNVIDALRDKRSEITVVGFGTVAGSVGSAVDVSDEDARRRLKDDVDDLETGGDVGGATNWEAALSAVRPLDLDVVVLITDGVPTVHGNPPQQDGEPALAAAKTAADQLKSAGTRVVAVGIDLAAGGEENLAAVTGPVAGQDHFTGGNASLLRQLYDIVAASCGVAVADLPTPEPAVFPWKEVLLGLLALLLLVGVIALVRNRGRVRTTPHPVRKSVPVKTSPDRIGHQDLVQDLRGRPRQDQPAQDHAPHGPTGSHDGVQKMPDRQAEPPREKPRRSMSLDFLSDPSHPEKKDQP